MSRDHHQHDHHQLAAAQSKQLTPSVSVASNGPDEEDNDDDDDDVAVDMEVEERRESRRARLSPSPEVDLSNPEEIASDDLVGDGHAHSTQPGNGFANGRGGVHPHNHHLSHNHSAPPPPLEGDEREFTQTASWAKELRERASAEDISARAPKRSHDDVDVDVDVDEKMHTADADAVEAPATQQHPDEGHSQSLHTEDRHDYFPSDFIQSQDKSDHDHDHDQQQQQQQGTLAESDLFAQSRSPSASSELSSVSSSTSATSAHGDVERTTFDAAAKEPEGNNNNNDDINDGTYAYASTALKGPADITVGAWPAISAATKITTTRTHFRADTPQDPVGLLESKLQVDAAAFDDDDRNSEQLVIAGTDPENEKGEEGIDIEMVDPISSLTKPLAMTTSLGVLDHALSAESWSDLQSPETMDIHELDAIFADI